MTECILHILSPTRDGQPAVIAGNCNAMQRLQAALTQALLDGSGRAQLFSSDGEPFQLAVICESDMSSVYTSYLDEPDPQRSQREQRPVRSLDGYASVLALATSQSTKPKPQTNTVGSDKTAEDFLGSADIDQKSHFLQPQNSHT